MAKTLIATQTASSSSSLSFTSGIDSTYDVYEFHCINIHPSGTSLPNFGFQVDTGTNTNYNQTITSSYFAAAQSSSWTGLYYSTGEDQAQGTAFQKIAHGAGDEDAQSSAVILKLYAPSSTTYVKHFTSTSQMNHHHSWNYVLSSYSGGYINTTTAITRVQFKFDSGNIDAGTIKMFGVS